MHHATTTFKKQKSCLHHTVLKSNLFITGKGIAWPQSQFLHSVSVSDFYIPRIGHIFGCSKIDRQILEIYKSLTNI